MKEFLKYLDALLFPVVVFTVAALILRVISFFTKKVIDKNANRKDGKSTVTFMTLLRSGARYLIYIAAVIICLTHLGFEDKVSSALVAAGVGGLILTLGTQTMVKDIISGLTIAVEKPYLVGDYILAAGYEGEVKAISLKSTYLESYGKKIVIPNGNISNVVNYSGNELISDVVLSVPVKTPLKTAENALNKVIEKCYKEHKDMLVEMPTYKGVISMNHLSYELCVHIRTVDYNYWAIDREIKTEFRKMMDKTICI